MSTAVTPGRSELITVDYNPYHIYINIDYNSIYRSWSAVCLIFQL